MSLVYASGLAGARSLGLGRRGVSAPTRVLRPQGSRFALAAQNGRALPYMETSRLSRHSIVKQTSILSTSSIRVLSTEANEPSQVAFNELPEKLRIPRLPLAITAISLVPMFACSIIPFAFPFEIAGKALFMQMTYGAVSLSMLGSVHWGLAMSEYKRFDGEVVPAELPKPTTSDQMLRYVGGVLPAFASWMFMTQEPLLGMLGLMSGFAGLALFELGAHQARLTPAWYVRLRVPWTVTTLLCLGVNLIHLL